MIRFPLPVQSHGCPLTRIAEQGSVLVLAVWSLFFLGALSVAVGSHVAAQLRLAGTLAARQEARSLARAGVSLAVSQIECHAGEKAASDQVEWFRDPALFENNDSLPGGVFSVSCPGVASNSMQVVTNIGVSAESERINVNDRRNAGALSVLITSCGRADGPVLASRIMAWPLQKKRLAEEGGNQYAKNRYQSLYEMLLVQGMTSALFEALRPHLTLYGKHCYRGISAGKTSGDAGIAYQIEFVYDPRADQMVYWLEK
jgi:hypothetical protein